MSRYKSRRLARGAASYASKWLKAVLRRPMRPWEPRPRGPPTWHPNRNRTRWVPDPRLPTVAAGSDPGAGGFSARVPAARGYLSAIKWSFIGLLTVGAMALRSLARQQLSGWLTSTVSACTRPASGRLGISPIFEYILSVPLGGTTCISDRNGQPTRLTERSRV